jgi:hypothetical protein
MVCHIAPEIPRHLTTKNAWLYRNDRQIKQVTYRETESSQTGYTITIRGLET